MIRPNSSNIRFVRNVTRPTQQRRPLNNNINHNSYYSEGDGNNIYNNNDNNNKTINNSFLLPSTASRTSRKPPQHKEHYNTINNNKYNNNYYNEEIDETNRFQNNLFDWNDELRRFYIAINKPEKISGISKILDAWIGKEEEMLQSLIDKYHDDIPNYMRVHLDQIFDKMETGTESSFIKNNNYQIRKNSSNTRSDFIYEKKNTLNQSTVERLKSNKKSVELRNGRQVNKTK